MKKLTTLIVVISITITACFLIVRHTLTKNAHNTISYSESETEQPTSFLDDNKFDENIWYTAPGTELKVTLATPETESLFEDISGFNDGGNFANQRLLFATTKPEGIEMSFIAVEMDFDEEESESFLKITNIIATERVTPDRAFMVDWLDVGLMPIRGVTFVDEFGENRYFGISGDNIDPDEPGYTRHRMTEYPGPKTPRTRNEFKIDPDLSIYGKWEYIVSATSFYEWTFAPPTITVNDDNSAKLVYYESVYTGVMTQTDTYEFLFTAHDLNAEGRQYAITDENRLTKLIYNPNTKQLMNGERPYRKTTSYEFKHVAWFIGSSATITVFYTPISNNGISLDSLIFVYDQALQVVNLHNTIEPLHFYDPDFENFTQLEVLDLDYNRFSDIRFLRESKTGKRYDVFMYNVYEKVYTYDKKMSAKKH